MDVSIRGGAAERVASAGFGEDLFIFISWSRSIMLCSCSGDISSYGFGAPAGWGGYAAGRDGGPLGVGGPWPFG
jgi:hypothetical protein